ncbi:MAG: SDR family oxidoreductase [Spirochaetes bacterium]|nr:SDR family oxidoreductase [Spirochaetota bacterium]
MNIKNKWALITGASRGIGKEIAKAMAAEGCNLILHSRNIEHTKALAEELKGVKVFQIEGDLSDVSVAEKIADEAEKLSGGLDILYNNAAIMTKYRSEYYTAPADEYEISFKVNTIVPILICNRIIPKMIKRGFGRVINVTSGIKDEPELTPYAISKAALDKYVFDMAKKLEGTGVCMNLMDPGWLRTDLGGDKAPNSVESVIPGALVPVLLDEAVCGKLFHAQDYRK